MQNEIEVPYQMEIPDLKFELKENSPVKICYNLNICIDDFSILIINFFTLCVHPNVRTRSRFYSKQLKLWLISLL